MNWWRALLCWTFGLVMVEFRLDCDVLGIHAREIHLYPKDWPVTEVDRLCKAYGRGAVYEYDLYYYRSRLSWWVHPRKIGDPPTEISVL